MSVELLVLERAGAITVERVERVIKHHYGVVIVGIVLDELIVKHDKLVGHDVEFRHRKVELALVDLAGLVLVDLAKRVGDPSEVLGERRFELVEDVIYARLTLG